MARGVGGAHAHGVRMRGPGAAFRKAGAGVGEAEAGGGGHVGGRRVADVEGRGGSWRQGGHMGKRRYVRAGGDVTKMENSYYGDLLRFIIPIYSYPYLLFLLRDFYYGYNRAFP